MVVPGYSVNGVRTSGNRADYGEYYEDFEYYQFNLVKTTNGETAIGQMYLYANSDPTFANGKVTLTTGAVAGSPASALWNQIRKPSLVGGYLRGKMTLSVDDETRIGTSSILFEIYGMGSGTSAQILMDPSSGSHKIQCVSYDGIDYQTTDNITCDMTADHTFQIDIKNGTTKFTLDGVVIATHSTRPADYTEYMSMDSYFEAAGAAALTIIYDTFHVQCGREF